MQRKDAKWKIGPRFWPLGNIVGQRAPPGVVRLRASCLAFGPSAALRAEIRAVLAREARPELRAGPAQRPVIVSHLKILLIQQLAQIHSFKF